MKILDFIREFKKRISDVENNLHSEKQDFLEVYERNLQLEEEIEQRTRELNDANRRMLTLQHIWEMMNSSKPLSSVLEAIVKTLQGELGYLHSCIIQKKQDDNGKYLNIIAYSQDNYVSTLNTYLNSNLSTIRFDCTENYEKDCNEITQTKDLRAGVMKAFPDIKEEVVESILSNSLCNSYIRIPLSTKKGHFGFLLVFSTRDCATDAELNFLKLYSKQIELAITITDLFQVVREQAVTDGLTTLYNRRYFEEFLEKEYTRSKRQNQPFTLIGLDLDHLKQINDKFGHACGDSAICTVANVLKNNARSIDVAARIGGEEFNLILPGIDSKGGLIAAERIRKAIEETPVDMVGNITASIGVATYLEHTENLDELIELTDKAMYQSKRNGRNQVTLAKNINEISWQEVAMKTFMDLLSKERIPIPQEMSKELCAKLEQEHLSSSKEMLYSIADLLASTYNPLHLQGNTKSKVALSASLAKRFDLSKEETDRLRIAMLLYDIGNLLVPQEIFQKSSPLTEDEQSAIKSHPILATKDILQPISNIQEVIPIIEKHHENWDGSGYPHNLSKDEIPLSSQIILITDAYFALLEHRAYRSAMTSAEAIEAIKADAGKKWSETLVNEFVNLVESDTKEKI